MVKRLPKMRETWVRSLGWEDLLEKEMATHSSILAWKIPWTEEPGSLQTMGCKELDRTEHGFPAGSVGKESACNSGDPGLIPGSGRSPAGGDGNSLQYSCLKNSTDRGAWWATVHGIAKSRTRLSDFIFSFQLLLTFSGGVLHT